MSNQFPPKQTENDSNELAEIESQLSLSQIRFLVARMECPTDKEAAIAIGMTEGAVKSWNKDGSKQLIDKALRLMVHDGIVTAQEILRRSLAKAAAVKAAGLDADDERIRQLVATEIIDRGLGKVAQRTELTGKDGEAIKTTDEGHNRAISKLADALGEIVSGKGAEQNGEMDTTE